MKNCLIIGFSTFLYRVLYGWGACFGVIFRRVFGGGMTKCTVFRVIFTTKVHKVFSQRTRSVNDGVVFCVYFVLFVVKSFYYLCT